MEGAKPKRISLRSLPEVVQARVASLWGYELDARSVKFEVPQGLKDYDTAVTTAERLRLNNPFRSDAWCATAYVLLADTLDIPGMSNYLDKGYPAGVEDLVSLPRLKRHKPESQQEIIKSELAKYRADPDSFV